MSRLRFEVRDPMGLVISRHRTREAAERALDREARRLGLHDDGTYCSGDGWPAIVEVAS